jgi:hypothetical protein
VRFTDARDQRGQPWREEWMRAETLVPLPSDQDGEAAAEMRRAQVSSHAVAFADQPAAIGLVQEEIDNIQQEWVRLSAHGCVSIKPDQDLMDMAVCMDNRSKEIMIMLAHLVKPNDGMKYKLD